MNKSLKQSLKERLKVVANERNLTFEEVWHNLVLERFLARLCQSKYKTNLKNSSLEREEILLLSRGSKYLAATK